MAKLFAQLLLSAMVGIGAAAGFHPDVKGKVVETLTEVKAEARQTIRSAFEAIAGTTLGVDVAVNASAEGNAGVNTSADVQVTTEGGAVVDVNGVFDESASVDGSLSAESQTGVSAETKGIGFSLRNAINSVLGIGFGLGE
jgi:hypothetical protein